MKDKKLTTYQMAVTAVMAAVLCVLGPLTVPIGAVPISLANFVICLTAWLLGPKFGTLSVVIYLALGAIGIPVFSGYGAGLAKLAGPTGGYLVGYLLLAFIGGLFIEKSKGQPVISGIGLVLGDAACYVLGTAWFVFQMQCELGYALSVCVYPFIALDLAKIVETVVLVRIVVIADLAGSTETKIRSYTLYIIPGRLNTIRDFFIKSSTTPTTIAIINWS